MTLAIDVSLTYSLGAQRTALLALHAAPTHEQTVLRDRLDIADARITSRPGERGIGQRVWVQSNTDTLRARYRADVDVLRPAGCLDGAKATPLHDLPDPQITFLRPSRYCQSDLFEDIVADRFGTLAGGVRITAILDWIGDVMEYCPGHSTGETSMRETFASRKGVCRDFAHLFCGLVRASFIPARYVSAYGACVDPPDFHAVAQVWLQDRWHLVDPTGMCAAHDLAIIAVGRDAADVPFMETPDTARCIDQQVRVWTR